MATGNRGLNGCLDYSALDYSTSLHFATVGTDKGHDGASGLPFLNHPEVINDFAFRAVHVEAVIGKQIVQAYYGKPAAKSYYLGAQRVAAERAADHLLTLLGSQGQLLHPRYSPGAETGQREQPYGTFFQFAADWERYVVLNVTTHDFTNFGLSDIVLFDEVNGGDIATFDGDLSAFRNLGGKFIAYHGRRDPGRFAQLLSSTNSKRVYDLISDTFALPSLDDFYRLFLIPRMGHCSGVIGCPEPVSLTPRRIISSWRLWTGWRAASRPQLSSARGQMRAEEKAEVGSDFLAD
ncbi:tannase and feruloyl esterase-domain-containing protein [Mycena rosella]|uniref:Carboxylic ester hydrolase n=1 Tax=Mycena rosella TaxID=1033263 RepID=A0AAD7D2V6_MYCRO|nr:tannase and feruloyl esterase-domain-containing protein [Mycena rosella]